MSFPLVLFVARNSSCTTAQLQQKIDFLNESLDFTQHRYEQTFGHLDDDSYDRLISPRQQSNLHLGNEHPVMLKVRAHLDTARRTGRPAKLVLNGWDGLTTNPQSFDKLFAKHRDVPTTISVFEGNPRRFIEADIKDMLASASLDDEDEQAEDWIATHKDAAKIYGSILAIHVAKLQIGESTRQLLAESRHRNSPAEQFSEMRYECDAAGCTKDFAKLAHLRDHRKRRCGVEALKCDGCGKDFGDGGRADVLKTHRLTCPGLKRRAEDEIDLQHASKRTYTRDVRVDRRALGIEATKVLGGPQTYHDYQSRPEGLRTFNANDGPVGGGGVGNGELFCRYRGCNRADKFADTTSLKRHYKMHSIILPATPRGKKGANKMQEEKEWLEKLALDAHQWAQNHRQLHGLSETSSSFLKPAEPRNAFMRESKQNQNK